MSSRILEAHRALTGDDERVVERMDERAPGLLEQRGQPLEGFAWPAGFQVDSGAVSLRRLDLHGTRSLPHDDEAVDALQRRAVRKRLRVVPGRDPDHPRSPLVRGPGTRACSGLARLEGAGALEELCFQVDARPEGRRGEHGRPMQAARDGFLARLTSSGDGIGMLRSRAPVDRRPRPGRESALTAAVRGHRSCGRS